MVQAPGLAGDILKGSIMALQRFPFIDGEAIVPIGAGQLTRDSDAWNMDSGTCCRENRPRVTPSVIPVYKRKPKIYHTFPAGEVFMTYDAVTTDPEVTGFYWAGSGGRQEKFEREFPEFEKIVLGQSSGQLTGSKDIVGYRLCQIGQESTPLSTKHWLLTSGCHGNEQQGVNGAIQACQIIARNSDFQKFREEWTLLFVPSLNPDGWFSFLRNLEVYGANGRTVNLNRNWNWFWAEYVETSAESKGTAVADTPEALAILDYKDLVEAAGGTISAVLDSHATGIDQPSRYQSRDRIWSHILLGPGQDYPDEYNGILGVPTHHLTRCLDYYVWRIAGAVGAKRVKDEDGPDFFIRYYKSRFRPTMHAYFSSQGAFSMAFEDAKYDICDAGTETITSSCNFRMDYMLSFAHAITFANWEFQDGVLLEQPVTNILNNSSFTDWQDGSNVTPPTTPEPRPAYYTVGRAISERVTDEGDIPSFLQTGGESVALTSQTDIQLTEACEYLSAANDSWSSLVVLCPYPVAGGNLFRVPAARYAAGNIFDPGLVIHTQCYGAAIFYSGDMRVDILGGGTAPGTDPWDVATRVVTDNLDGAIPLESALTPVGMSDLMEMGFCDNFYVGPAAGNERGYLFGGYTGAADSDQISKWTPSTVTRLVSAQVLAAACRGICAVYVSSTEIYLFGGMSGETYYTTIQKYDPTADTISTLDVELPVGTAFMVGAKVYGEDYIFLIGGEIEDAFMSAAVYRFDIVEETIEAITPLADLDDDEGTGDNAGATSDWVIALGRMAGRLLPVSYGDVLAPITFMGGRLDSYTGLMSVEFYSFDWQDNIIGLARSSDFGYLRYSTAIDDSYAGRVLLNNDFEAGDHTDWNDPSTVWTVGSGVLTPSAAGWASAIPVPIFSNQKFTFIIKKAANADIGSFIFVFRATIQEDNELNDDGYSIVYSEASNTWFLKRAGSTLVEGAGGDIAITTAARTGVLEVMGGTGDGPVHITLTYNSIACIDYWDLEATRIVRVGRFGMNCTPDATTIQFNSFLAAESGVREAVYSAAALVKSGPDNASGYFRFSLEPKDDYSTVPVFTTRRVRHYYTMPSENFFTWHRIRVDLRMASRRYAEDGLRYFLRIYKDSQRLFFEGPLLARGSLIGTSYQRDDYPRAAEIFEYSDLLDINDFDLSIIWAPTTAFVDLDADLTLLEVYIGLYSAGDRLAIVAKGPADINARFCREYNVDDVYGPHDPVIQLQRWEGATMVASKDLICYWGYSLRDTAPEPEDDVLHFRLINVAGELVRFEIDHMGADGRATILDEVTAYADSGLGATLRLQGCGYFGPPVLRQTQDMSGRVRPRQRPGLLHRPELEDGPAIMMGVRDPLGGQQVNVPYKELMGVVFDTSDPCLSLGNWSTWDGLWETTGGVIHAVQSAALRWLTLPKHADVRLTVQAKMTLAGQYAGLITYMDYRRRNIALPYHGLEGYSAEIFLNPGTPEYVGGLRIARWHRGVAVVLASTQFNNIAANTFYSVELEVLGSLITARACGAEITATDTNFRRPCYCGLVGYTAAVGQIIYFDDFNLYPNFPDTIT
jgi:hypothetical protein